MIASLMVCQSMQTYKICGNTFTSSISIPELAPACATEPAFHVRYCSEPRDFSTTGQWFNQWQLPDGEIWLALAKTDDEYLLHFPALVNFVVSDDARHIACYPQPDVPLETTRHLLLNQVIPLVLSHLGKTVLHASACATPKGVMAFMGMTGAGKSTLAAGFALQGYPMLTDDCLLAEAGGGEVRCVASYPGSRLWPESVSALFAHEPELNTVAHYTEKKRLVLDQQLSDDSWPLRAVYVIAEPAEVEEDEEDSTELAISPLSSPQALLELVKHTFQLDNRDRAKSRLAFKQFEQVAKAVPFFRIAYPRDFASFAAVQQEILTHFNQISAP